MCASEHFSFIELWIFLVAILHINLGVFFLSLFPIPSSFEQMPLPKRLELEADVLVVMFECYPLSKKTAGFFKNLSYPLPFSFKQLHIKVLNSSAGERCSFQLCLMWIYLSTDIRNMPVLKHYWKVHVEHDCSNCAVLNLCGHEWTNHLGEHVIWAPASYCLTGSAKIGDCFPVFLPKPLQLLFSFTPSPFFGSH